MQVTKITAESTSGAAIFPAGYTTHQTLLSFNRCELKICNKMHNANWYKHIITGE
jgi:hypothetical protein